MSDQKLIKIFIDNFAGGDEQKFAKRLQERLLGLRINSSYSVKIFSDLDDPLNEHDINNEQNTTKEIRESHIVIPIVTSSYVAYVTRGVENAFNEIIKSDDRYLFPFLLTLTDWSSHEWIVKSQIAPRDAVPFYELSQNDKDKLLNEFINTIYAAVVSLSREDLLKPELISSSANNRNAIFISHDHDDADFAELLKLKLEKHGIDSWIDTERLKVGQDWREEIDQGIINSVGMIVIMTPEARKSEYVTYEWAFAWGNNKKIFPIMLKQTQLHPRLESLQYLNFTNNPTRPWADLIASIINLTNS